MESLAFVFSSGWASGVNAPLVVLALGAAERLGHDQVPDVLGRWEVLLAATVLFMLEFIADKVPLIDSTWDALSTAIRPTVGAVVGVLLAGQADSLSGAVAAVVGGGTALASHLVKAGGRLALNTSPEPVSNSVASVLEDLAVLGVLWFAIAQPAVAAVMAGVLLLLGAIALWSVMRHVRRGLERWRGRKIPPPPPPPADHRWPPPPH